jgi:mannobiose 2-epimerase
VDRTWTQPLIKALSEVDIPCSKSMNTNLHVLEALSSLYLATSSSRVLEALTSLLDVFETKILVTPEHLGLYFDRDWSVLTDHVSFGHDIEASWLLTEAAEIACGHPLPAAKKEIYVRIARRTLEVLKANGGSLPNETHGGELKTERIWWIQAETMVGLVNAWELTGEDDFFAAAEAQWSYIDRFVVDRLHGEWHWQVSPDGQPDLDRPKGGLWKTSYHNGRACMEVIRRLSSVQRHSEESHTETQRTQRDS